MNGQLVFHLGLPVYCLVISVIQLPLQLCQEHLAAIWEDKHMYEWYSQYMKFGSRKVYLLNYSVLCCQNVKQNSCQTSCWINRQFTINPTSCNRTVRRMQNDAIKLHAFCWIWVCCCWLMNNIYRWSYQTFVHCCRSPTFGTSSRAQHSWDFLGETVDDTLLWYRTQLLHHKNESCIHLFHIYIYIYLGNINWR